MARRRRRSYGFPEYVPVGARRARALLEARRAAKRGEAFEPVQVEARRRIAATHWGRAWCDHIESFHDYSNRLPRGRTYVRNGSVVDLQIARGQVTARVAGSSLYRQTITIAPCRPKLWKHIVARCSGQIGSLVELLAGRISEAVMEQMTRDKDGLFPDLSEVSLACSCPDWAHLCKHLAAVLYGVGARLDERPELLFELRGVDPGALVDTRAIVGLDAAGPGAKTLDGDLSSVFGIDVDEGFVADDAAPMTPHAKRPQAKAKAKPRPRKKPKLTITRQELLALGVPPGTISTWTAQGVLAATKERGVYRHTKASRERLPRYHD